MRPIARRSLAAAGAVLLAAAVAAVWLTATETGLRSALGAAGPFFPAALSVGSVDGRLVGPLVLIDVDYDTPGMRVTVERIELEWRPASLIGGTVEIERLIASGVEVLRRPAGGEAVDTAGDAWRPPDEISLPVDIEVATAGIDGLRLRAGPEAEPFDIDTIRLAVAYRGEALVVDGLELAGPLVEAEGRADVETHGQYETDLEIEWRWVPPDRPDVDGRLAVSGGLDALEVRARIEPPYALAADLVVRGLLEGPALDGTLRGRIEPASIGWDAPISEADADLSVGGPLDALDVSGRVDVVLPDLVAARIDIAGTWRGDGAQIDRLDVADRNSDARLALAGRIAIEPEIEARLTGTWQNLAWPPSGEAAIESRRGDIELSGTPDDLVADLSAELGPNGRIEGRVRRAAERFDAELAWRDLRWPQQDTRFLSDNGRLDAGGTFDAYRFSLDAGLAAVDRPSGVAGRVAAEGAGDAGGLELERLELAVLDGTLVGNGRVAWEPVLDGAIELELSSLDPGALLPDWGGSVSGHLAAAASAGESGLTADVERLELDGTLRGRAIELAAAGTYDAPRAFNIERISLRSGMSRLSLSGSVGERVDAEWDIDSPDLADLWPGLEGRLSTAGSAEGPLDRPLVSIAADGGGIVFRDWGVESLRLDAIVDAALETESNVEIEVSGARLADREVRRLDVRASGDASTHRASAAVAANGADVELALSGTLERPWQQDYEWRFEVDEGRVAYGELAPWMLDDSAAGALSAQGAELSRACWRSMDATLCADAARRDGGTIVSTVLEQLPFRYFAPYLPDGAVVEGSFSASARLELPRNGRPSGELAVETSPSRIGSRGRAAVPGLRFAAAGADMSFDGERLDVELSLPLAREQGWIDASGALTIAEGEPLTAGAVDARVVVGLDDLRFISDLVRGVDRTTGAASMDVSVSGTVASPRVAGRIALENGGARLRAPGIELEDVRIVLDGDGDGDIAIAAAASSGGGTLEADGHLGLTGAQPVGRLAVRGEDFELYETPDARVWVSPDLQLDVASDRIELTGRVTMPRARFTPREMIEGAVTVTEDQIIVDAETAPERRFTRPFYARVELALGDDIIFDGFGLTGRLAGALEVIEVPREPVTGSGELRVERGTYEAYGQELDVRTGRLLFAGGALTRPGLDIEAVREPTEDILVGARVRGTLERPELSVFSEPPMPRQEQLSYLLLGRPLESTSTSETSTLSQAAMALGLRGGNFVSDRLNETLGFDEFGIQSQPAEAASASFVIGKYLTPSLYVSYGVGLFEQVNTLRLRYTISSRWRLVTESSSVASGGDLIYNIERGN